MRSRSLLTVTGVVLLTIAAAVIGVRFRLLPPPVDLRAMTWDAASHALIGLDLFDHIRRLEPLLLLLRLQAEHWWPPLFGILSLPAWAFGGRELTSPSLVSLASYIVIPPIVWLSVRRVTSAVPLMALGLVAVFLLRSPQLLEMSAWSMLELSATLFAALAFFFFLGGRGSRARNWGYGFAGASTLLKYHYGFFLLVTFGAATILELTPEERRDLGRALVSRLRQRAIWIPALAVAAAVAARLIAEQFDPDPALPGVPTILWIAYIALLVAMLVRRPRTRELWLSLPTPVRRFLSCGLIWPAVWSIDLANVQVWYRQLRVSSDPPARWAEQISELARYLTDDYFLGPVALTLGAAGLAISIVAGFRRRRIDLLAVAFHTIWPVALMSLSSFRIEPRFLSTMMAPLVLSAVLGWALLLERRPTAVRIAASVVLLAVVAAEQLARTDAWGQHLVRRRVYVYLSSDPPDRFVRATVQASARGEPVL
ncbi:MAG TPA: hypothetical protein VM779_15900, partial [Thermoanaerobaculia bacterium]|nr:hypothetical protein [Thermoanaerobaculia bacterium]